MPSKNELIERIRQINTSADGKWLERFDQRALVNYLDHLQLVIEPRGASSVWRRRGDTAAVVALHE